MLTLFPGLNIFAPKHFIMEQMTSLFESDDGQSGSRTDYFILLRLFCVKKNIYIYMMHTEM